MGRVRKWPACFCICKKLLLGVLWSMIWVWGSGAWDRQRHWSSSFHPVQLSHYSIKTCLKWAADKTSGGDAAHKWVLEGNFPAVSSEGMKQAAPRAPDKCLGSFFFREHGESLRRAERLEADGEMKPKAAVGNSCCQDPTLSCTWGRAWRGERKLSKVCCDLSIFPCSFPLWAVLDGIIYKILQMPLNSVEEAV